MTLTDTIEVIKLLIQDKEKDKEIKTLKNKLDNIRKIINDDDQSRL